MVSEILLDVFSAPAERLSDLTMRVGEVTGLSLSAGTVNVTVGGQTYTGMNILHGYVPKTGDQVAVFYQRPAGAQLGGWMVCTGAKLIGHGPLGLIARGFNNANSSTWNSTTPVVVQTVDTNFIAGRNYRVTSHIRVGRAAGSNVAGDFVVMEHKVDGVAKNSVSFFTDAAVAGLAPNCFAYITEIDDATTATKTVTTTGLNLSGSGSHQILADSGGNDRCSIAVDDLGSLI